MRERLRSETGLSLIELLAAITILGFLSVLLMSVFISIRKVVEIQRQKVELQLVGNQISAKLETISQIEGLYEAAGYLGKFKPSEDGKMWEEQLIVKVLTPEQNEIGVTDQGENKIGITDILDGNNERQAVYQIKNPEIKIKLLQRKNKNDTVKTHYGLPNYRDTFTIQTSIIVLFYEGQIDFGETKGVEKKLDIEAIKQLDNVKYFREVELTYRDEKKAKGELPGNGRW